MVGGGDVPDPIGEACLDLAALDALASSAGAPGPVAGAHLEACPRCRGLFDDMRSANRFLRRFRTGEVDAGSDAPADPASIRIPGYEVRGVLAFGGQGAVYRAVQEGTGRDVAVKIPLSDTQRRPSARYRFEREIELTARLDHAGIVRVIGPCELADGRVGCVMEFIEGEPFDAWAEAQRGAGRGAARRIVLAGAQVADAIAYAHQRAVLHRDIKPSNVVVTGADSPRVLDFGLAKALGDSAESFATLTGAFVGTLCYSAPEQVTEGADAIDMRTDVYTLGLLLYQALTGRLPYAADAPTAELLRQIREAAPARPSSLAPEVGGELDAVLLRALSKEKDRRYASAAELRDDLRAWLDGRAVQARIDSRWYVVRKALARNRRAIALGLVIFVAVVGGAVVSAYNMLSASEAQRRERYETLRAASEVSRADAVQQVIDELLPMTEGGGGASRENLDRLDAKLEAGLLRDRPLVESSVRALLGSIYADRGADALAEYNYRQALGLSRRELGPDHPETAQLADRLANALVRRGKLDEAHALAREALAARTAALGPAHADVGESLVTLAGVELERGETVLAAGLADRAAAVLADAPTATGRQAILCASLRARIAGARGGPARALGLATEALRLALRNHSAEHPVVIHAIRDVAAFTAASGDTGTAAADAALADALGATRTADRSAAVWGSLIELKARVLGADAPELASSYTFLGRASEREDDQQGAVRAHYRALEILRKSEGEDSLAVADCAYYLQYPLARLGRMEEWADLLEHRYRVYRREHLGRANIAIVVAHREWAAALGNIGRDARAEEELGATLEEIRTLCHGDPFETIRVRTTLAEVLAAGGDVGRAAEIAAGVSRVASDQQAAERQRVAIVLALASAERGAFGEAAAHLETYRGLADLSLAGLTGARGVNRRILDRLMGAYAAAGEAEPQVMAELRGMHGLGPG